jgi:hypothetical protein
VNVLRFRRPAAGTGAATGDAAMMGFVDVLGLTVVGLLWTWSPERTAVITLDVPQVRGRVAPVASAPPLAVQLGADRVLRLDAVPVSVEEVVRRAETGACPIRVDADRALDWGTVAAEVAALRARWPWVQAGVRQQP